MSAKNEIVERYLMLHSELETRFYDRKEITKDEFSRLHGELWHQFEEEMVTKGFRKWVFTYHLRNTQNIEILQNSDRELTSSEIDILQTEMKCQLEFVDKASIEVES